MRQWMLKTSTAVVAAAALTVSAFGQSDQRGADVTGGQGQQQQQRLQGRTAGEDARELEQARQRDKQEADAQGSRRVQVREQALWGLGELPPRLMHKSMEKLTQEPDEAHKCVMQAANILELQAALAQGQGQGQGQGAGEQLMQQAENLRQLAQRIEYKQVLSKEELKQPFADAALAAAAFYQQAAQAGLQRQDEEQTGYTLKGAAEYLAAAHAFGERQPTAQVSRAIFDAERMSGQIIKMSKTTTLQDDRRQARSGAGEAEGDLAQPAGARQGGRQQEAAAMPNDARQVIASLGAAIGQVDPAAAPARGTGAEPGGAERISRPADALDRDRR